MEFPREARAAAPRGLLIVSVAMIALTAFAILVLDKPIANLASHYEPWGIWDAGIHALEWCLLIPLNPSTAAVGLGLGMVATLLVPKWRVKAPAWIFAAGTHLITAFLMSHLKEWTGRVRPWQWFALQGAETFGRKDGFSFPSGHVTTFGAIAIIIAVLYPRHRIAMGVIIAFVCVARVCMNAHWFSDTTGGVALATMVAYVLALAIRPLSPR